MVKVEQVKVVGTHWILEGPHWDVDRQSLYFNDILEGKIYRYDYQDDKVFGASIEGEPDVKIGFITPVQDQRNQFIVGAGPRLLLIDWDGISPLARRIKVVTEVDQENGRTRFNDGKADPQGRIFSGTMLSEEHGDIFNSREGTFYRITKGIATKLSPKICISNGLAWNEKTKKFYYIDSGDLNLKEYDYNPTTGEISNEKIVLEVAPNTYVLDGQTIDKNGFLYIATFNGGRVLKVDPVAKKIVQEIQIPVPQVTSVAFGGPNLDELFVTTADLDKKGGFNGSLFKVTGLGVQGTEMFNAKF